MAGYEHTLYSQTSSKQAKKKQKNSLNHVNNRWGMQGRSADSPWLSGLLLNYNRYELQGSALTDPPWLDQVPESWTALNILNFFVPLTDFVLLKGAAQIGWGQHKLGEARTNWVGAAQIG